ncbi:MAG: hypothetical protein JXQ29_08230, partial [Planctomycetes bacterium]|nr:hypothetical protein [Planctomycetota bacterium]
QVGGRQWATWNQAMKKAILDHQRKGQWCEKGSWDPIGPWGKDGGRVYSTALMVLTLSVYYTYSPAGG